VSNPSIANGVQYLSSRAAVNDSRKLVAPFSCQGGSQDAGHVNSQYFKFVFAPGYVARSGAGSVSKQSAAQLGLPRSRVKKSVYVSRFFGV
ncbi:MAG: hypothetical protein L0387_08370, partial [Acidobacteria bacterium]|nr:hypothetical protein [Acidobacteriota bacterium]